MRLLMTADTVGGVWTYALDLARGLSAHGVETIVAVLGPPPSPLQYRQAEGLTLLETGLALDWRADTEREVAVSAEGVAALAQRHGANLVHLNSPSLAALARFGMPLVGVCHSCLASWWAATRDGALPETLAWQRDLLARGYAACDRLVAPSAAFASATARFYGVLPHVVRNGRAPGPRAAGPRERCVLTAGRLWDVGKNAAALNAAAALIDAPVYAAGPLQMPPGGAIALSHAHPLGVLSAEELRGRMMRSAIFASLAVYEPFGLGVLEAAQCGCALVLSDIDSFRELWAEAAIFVPADDPARCARVLGDLLDDPVEASRLGEAARERASRYSVEAMATGMLGQYRAVLETAGAAA